LKSFKQTIQYQARERPSSTFCDHFKVGGVREADIQWHVHSTGNTKGNAVDLFGGQNVFEDNVDLLFEAGVSLRIVHCEADRRVRQAQCHFPFSAIQKLKGNTLCPDIPQILGVGMDEASSSCPMSSSSAQGTGCPVAHEQIDPRNQMAAQPNQNPSPGQRYPLPTDRRKSSIPRSSTGGSGTAEGNKGRGEEKEEEVWLYPSPQMFYNAMRRKGWDPREEDMTTVVGIHNAVNERTWNQVLEWERLHQR